MKLKSPLSLFLILILIMASLAMIAAYRNSQGGVRLYQRHNIQFAKDIPEMTEVNIYDSNGHLIVRNKIITSPRTDALSLNQGSYDFIFSLPNTGRTRIEHKQEVYCDTSISFIETAKCTTEKQTPMYQTLYEMSIGNFIVMLGKATEAVILIINMWG